MMMKKTKTSIGIIVLAVALAAGLIWTPPAQSQEGFIGEVIMFAGNFAPRSWALCDGQLLAISSNSALFSILGTTYGGDGRTTFALPDLRGRVPIHAGTGPGLPIYRLGQKGGNYQALLTVNNLPSHTHTATATVHAFGEQGDQQDPEGAVLAYDRRETQYSASAPDVTMNAESVTVTVANAGNGQAFNIMPPYLAVNYIICLQGIYPSWQ